MSRLIEQALQHVSFLKEPTLDDYLLTDQETRAIITNMVH